MSTNQKCPKCNLRISRTYFRFCLRCGQDLNRGAIHVQCCDKWVMDTWASRNGYVPFCPYCGRLTNQKPRVVRERERAELQKAWEQKRERENRALNPPLLGGVDIRVRDVSNRNELAHTVVRDIISELNHRDNRIVVIGETIRGADELFRAFQSHSERPTQMGGILIIDPPTAPKAVSLADQFSQGRPVFTTEAVLPGLRLKLANRIFQCVRTISDDLLKSLGKLTSPLNFSKDPIIFEYDPRSSPARHQRIEKYRAEEATIVQIEEDEVETDDGQ